MTARSRPLVLYAVLAFMAGAFALLAITVSQLAWICVGLLLIVTGLLWFSTNRS